MEEDEIGRTCSSLGRNEKCTQNFGMNTLREDHFEDLGVDW
jgi:hypothetical protein